MPFISESVDSIDGESVYSEFRPAMLFSFFPSFERLSLRSVALHTVAYLCTSANLANSARHTCSNRFFFAGL